MIQKKIHLVKQPIERGNEKTRCGMKLSTIKTATFDRKHTTCNNCLKKKTIYNRLNKNSKWYLIRLYAKKHKISPCKMRNIKHKRCAYCLGSIKEKGFMRKFHDNKILLYRCMDCSWKLGLCNITKKNLNNGYLIKNHGIWNNPFTLEQHKKEIMKKYGLV